MAGRGRGATLPAWMTAGGSDGMNGNGNSYPQQAPSYEQPGQYEDYNQAPRHPPSYVTPAAPAPVQYHSAPPVDQYQRHGHLSHAGHSGHGAQPDYRDRRPAEVDNRESRNSSNSGTGSRIGSWKRGGTRVSNFDVRPPDGVELPPIGVSSTSAGVPNSYFSYANNPAVSGAPLPGTGMAGVSKYGAPAPSAHQSQPDGGMMTRHARRIYAGGIPPRATEIEIANFFNDIVTRALAPVRPDTLPVQKVYLNTEKCYAFVEFSTIELTTACMALDGVKFDHYTGSTIVRVRRPNDYRPEMLPPPGPIPVLNVSVLGITGVSSSMGGPGKVFIGGLPYNLQDEQVMELMGAFGAIKAFHQVRDPGSVTSKGYGFCEYVNPANAEQAIAGLNGMALGDKTLTVRIATQGASNSSGGGGGGAAAAMLQQQQMMMGMGGLGGMPGMGGMGGIGQPPIGAMGAGAYGAGAGMGGMPMSTGGMGAAPAGGAMGGHPPTRVLRLSNMVTRDDLYNEAEYQDIREDVRLECLQYGKVLTVIIPRACDNYSPSAEGLIFVEFDTVGSAVAAAAVLNGRKFADKTVVVSYFSEQDYASQRLI